MIIIKNIIFLSVLIMVQLSWGAYDACSDKNIEFCVDADKPPVFNYEPKKIVKKIKKQKKIRKKKVVLDKTIHFSKGEIDKNIELLEYKGGGNSLDTISSEGFDPNKDYFIEDKSGPDEIVVEGIRVRVRKVVRNISPKNKINPTGTINAKSEAAAQTEIKKIFTVGENGKLVSRDVKVTTYTKKITPVENSTVSQKKGLWGTMMKKYQSLQKNVLRPQYEKVKAKIKGLFNRFFGKDK